MGIFEHDTYPAENRQPGCLKASATMARKKIATDAEGRSLKCRRRDQWKTIDRIG